jgi:hypothetical protein
MRLRIADNGRKKIRLWLPLFLLWPGLLVLAVVVAPLALLLALIASGPRGAKRWAMACWYLYASICALRGLNVEVDGKGDQVLVSIR